MRHAKCVTIILRSQFTAMLAQNARFSRIQEFSFHPLTRPDAEI